MLREGGTQGGFRRKVAVGFIHDDDAGEVPQDFFDFVRREQVARGVVGGAEEDDLRPAVGGGEKLLR